MPAWTSAVEARTELRRFLSDGPQDRPVKNKAVIGAADGSNQIFYTFEDRIVDQSIVFSYNFVEQASAIVSAQDLVMGRFTLTPAPPANTEIRARYYWQLFLDEDLDEALRLAAGEIHETDDITQVEPGLKNAALHYGAAFGYTKQSTRWAVQRQSDRFLLREAPVDDGSQNAANGFRDAAKTYMQMAVDLRSSFYQRHGRRDAPAFNVYKPRIPSIGPRR